MLERAHQVDQRVDEGFAGGRCGYTALAQYLTGVARHRCHRRCETQHLGAADVDTDQHRPECRPPALLSEGSTRRAEEPGTRHDHRVRRQVECHPVGDIGLAREIQQLRALGGAIDPMQQRHPAGRCSCRRSNRRATTAADRPANAATTRRLVSRCIHPTPSTRRARPPSIDDCC